MYLKKHWVAKFIHLTIHLKKNENYVSRKPTGYGKWMTGCGLLKICSQETSRRDPIPQTCKDLSQHTHPIASVWFSQDTLIHCFSKQYIRSRRKGDERKEFKSYSKYFFRKVWGRSCKSRVRNAKYRKKMCQAVRNYSKTHKDFLRDRLTLA